MTQGDLKAILEAGDVDACLAYFEHATEDERKAVAQLTLDWYAKQHAKLMIQESPNSWRVNPLLGTAAIAVLASCSLAQIKKRGWSLWPRQGDLRVFEARKPPWLTEFAAWSLERNPMIWPSVRALERAGLCRRPDTDHYVLGMIVYGPSRHGPPVREVLLNDPELLEHAVWRVFEVEGSGELSLAARDKYCRAELTWETGLVALAADGVLPRGRLLDASLDALERDLRNSERGGSAASTKRSSRRSTNERNGLNGIFICLRAKFHPLFRLLWPRYRSLNVSSGCLPEHSSSGSAQRSRPGRRER